jgi:hypothetical protein
MQGWLGLLTGRSRAGYDQYSWMRLSSSGRYLRMCCKTTDQLVSGSRCTNCWGLISCCTFQAKIPKMWVGG